MYTSYECDYMSTTSKKTKKPLNPGLKKARCVRKNTVAGKSLASARRICKVKGSK